MKVIVTGAGALLGQGIIRSLLEGALRPQIVAVDPSPLATGLYWSDKRHIIPAAGDPEYLHAVERLLAKERPEALLVGTDVELKKLADARADLEAEYGTQVVVSSPKVVRIADDKFLTYRFMKEHGFAAPESCLPGGEEELIAKVGFPLVVKPRIGARSVGVSVVYSREELSLAVNREANPVIQECVATDKDEYTAGVLVVAGNALASIVMRRDLRDGNTYRAFVDDFPQLNDQVRVMAEALGVHGPVNFQFRLDGGIVKVFEINARFSGTTPLRMRAGFNEVDMLLGHLLQGKPISQPACRKMAIFRHWSETVVADGGLLEH